MHRAQTSGLPGYAGPPAAAIRPLGQLRRPQVPINEIRYQSLVLPVSRSAPRAGGISSIGTEAAGAGGNGRRGAAGARWRERETITAKDRYVGKPYNPCW